MFFGHEVKSNNQAKTTPLTLETDIKLSQAVLDPAGKGKKEPVCLMAEVNGKSFILAVLDPSQSWQCALDLVLASGTAVKFFLRGSGTVHLTGYEIRDDMGDELEMSMSSSDEEDEEEEAKPVEKVRTPAAKNIPVKTKGKSPATNGVKPAAKTNGKPSLTGEPDDSDEDSDDDDFDVSDISDDDDLSDEDLDDDDDDDDENLSFGEMGDSDDDDEMADMDDEDDDDDGEDDDDDDDDEK